MKTSLWTVAVHRVEGLSSGDTHTNSHTHTQTASFSSASLQTSLSECDVVNQIRTGLAEWKQSVCECDCLFVSVSPLLNPATPHTATVH